MNYLNKVNKTECNFNIVITYICCLGRAIAHAVSRWLPTAAARVRTRGLFKCDLWWTDSSHWALKGN
jgi:hypothetical protein